MRACFFACVTVVALVGCVLATSGTHADSDPITSVRSNRPNARPMTAHEHVTHTRQRKLTERKGKQFISSSSRSKNVDLNLKDVLARLGNGLQTDEHVSSPSSPLSGQTPATVETILNQGNVRERRTDDSCDGNLSPPLQTEYTFLEGDGGLSLTWLGIPKGEMFVVCSEPIKSKKTNVYYSTDYGKNFTSPKGISEPIIDVYVGAVGTDGKTWIYALPLDTTSKFFYLSRDSGVSFAKVSAPVHLTNMYPHESRPGWFLGMVEDSSAAVTTDTVYLCENADAPAPSFRLLKSRVFWTEWLAEKDETVDKTDTVLMLRFEGAVTQSLAGLDLIRWEYPFTEKQDVVAKRGVYDFEQINQYLITTELPKDNGFNERNLYVSSDEGHSFRRAIFPFSGRENHFKVIDATEDMIFAVVQHTFTRTEGSVFYVEINSPASMVVNITASKATFSPANPTGRSGKLSVVLETGNPTGCTATGAITTDVKGKVVMVDRGSCHFVEKAVNAENRGAAGIIIVSDSEEVFRMHASADKDRPAIPAYLIRKSDGDKIKRAIAKNEEITISFIEDDIREMKLWEASHLYGSDVSGTRFSVVLKDVMYEAASRDSNTGYIYPETADVFKVESQTGTYIANQFISSENRLVSLITYNKGALWNTIPQPAGARCDSAAPDDCNLHLALEFSEAINDIPLPISTEEGPGIVVANGFVGRGVGARPNDASVFVSRDGGLTWALAKQENGNEFEGPHSFRLLDHGGVIVAVSTDYTDAIYFSVDEGRKFYKFTVAASANPDDDWYSGESIQITTEPGGASLVMYAYFGDPITGSWIGRQINFLNILISPCNDDSDYEVWYPGRISGDEDESKICILGEHIAYRRRKPCSICYNGFDHEKEFEDMEHSGEHEKCACSNVDYMCAPGFFRPYPLDPKGKCTFDYDSSVSITCSTGEVSRKLPHYRLVTGDVCTPSDDSAKVYDSALPTKCTKWVGMSSAMRFLISMSVIGTIVLLVAGVLWWSPAARQRVIRIFGVGDDGACSRVGSALASCSCFRQSTTFKYSQLALDEEGGDLESEDDELLFGLEDAQAKH